MNIDRTKYADNAEACEELGYLGTALWDARKIAESPRFKEWMKNADKKAGTGCIYIEDRVLTSIKMAQIAYDELMFELEKAG